MKKYLFIIAASLSLLFAACKKEEEGARRLYGNWKLTETLNDIGDGSSQYIKAKEVKYLKLTRSGNTSGDAMPDVFMFKVLDSANILMIKEGKNKSFKCSYIVTEQTLTLNLPCIEACGLKFIRE
jgi:hypothetical protein